MPTPQVWNGTSWTALTKAKCSYWNGSSWAQPSDIKVWNGSAWTSIFATSGNVALRASASNSVAATNSISATIPASTQAGDFMVLAVAQTNFATTVFNPISGWTKQGEQRAGGAAHTLAIFTRLAQAGDASSTVTSTSSVTENMTIQVRVFSGVNQTTQLDAVVAFDQVSIAGTTGSAPAVTIATSGSMIMTVFTVPTTANTTMSGTDWTDPTGFSNELATCNSSVNNNAAMATYTETAPGTGSQGPFAATASQSRRWALATIAIRPA